MPSPSTWRSKPRKPPVLQGERGLSQKGPEPGNASYYYSISRLATRGTVTVAGEKIPVTGEAWLDREWSTSALGPDLAGWDWFALQLEDGRELMFYRLRRKDGAADPWSRGSLVAADGSSRTLGAADVELTTLSTWQSPTGASYPAQWRLHVAGRRARPRAHPESREPGARRHRALLGRGGAGERNQQRNQPIAGHGFVEMTGYAPPRTPEATPMDNKPGGGSAGGACRRSRDRAEVQRPTTPQGPKPQDDGSPRSVCSL